MQDWDAKVGSQKILGVMGKFSFSVQNEAVQEQTDVYKENAPMIENTLYNNTREDSTHGHHQIINTKIRL